MANQNNLGGDPENRDINPKYESQVFQTLPDSFNSMINEPINVGNHDTQEIIEMLGNKLGINDYKTNLTTFWLLDAMALEIIRNEEKLDSINLGILVSWIAGEAKLIQEQHFTRIEFFQKINFLFAKAFDLLVEGKPLMYWEEIIEVESFLNKEQELNVSEEFPKEEIRSRHSMILEQKSDPVIIITPIEVLETIIESTYVMYANSFHYETVSAAFDKSIEIHSYKLPYTLCIPRPVKSAATASVNMKIPNESMVEKKRLNINKKKPSKGKGKEINKLKTPIEIPPPPPSMTDEETNAEKKKYILPLMESNEANHLLEQYAKPSSTGSIVKTEMGKKGKKKSQ